MSFKEISRILGFYIWGLILPLMFPLAIAIYCEFIAEKGIYPQLPSALAFFETILACAALGAFFYFAGRGSPKRLFRREAIFLVLLVYLLTPIVGSLPFLFSKTLENPIDAFFEMTSGFTTTGGTILEAKNYDSLTGKEIPIKKSQMETTYVYYGTVNPVKDSRGNLLTGVEALSPALLFWRSFSQWLGGGGIVVLFVAILPALGVGGKMLYQAEITGPSKESLQPRIKEAASNLWKIYLGLTACEVILLIITNRDISFFEALTLSFSTLSTGGFSIKNASIGGYSNASTQWILTLFMIFGSISFSLYFFCMRGKLSRLNDTELKGFLLILVISCSTSAFLIWGKPGHAVSFESQVPLSFSEALRFGTFQTVSAISSTGFTIADYDYWPYSVQTLMLLLMFIGGMAGSTTGGLKVIRIQMTIRIILNKIESLFRPDAVRSYRFGKSLIDVNSAMTILCTGLVALLMVIGGAFFLVLDGFDPSTSLTTIISMLNNAGMSFGVGGPTDSFAFLTDFGKLLCCLWMVAGRLEYFALLILFVPAFWKNG